MIAKWTSSAATCLAEIGHGRLVGPDIERTTFEDLGRMLIDDYLVNQRKSLETAKGSLAALAKSFGNAEPGLALPG